MEKRIESPRAKFRQLAVLDIDPETILGTERDSRAVKHLIQAVKIADAIFWRQVSPDFDPQALLDQAGNDHELKEMLLFNYGPYDRLSDDAPLLPVPGKFPGIGFYPSGLTQEAFLEYKESHPESEKQFESPHTVIRRANSHLIAIPFHEAYEDLITKLSDVLAQAAASESHAAFRQFLAQRAADMRTTDFGLSDALWVNLTDNPIDLVIGPYEVYQDGLMGLKAAYEAFLLKRDFEDSAKVQHFQHELPKMCTSLEQQLNRSLTVNQDRVRISVADLVYAGGDANMAIPAIAFNLPNDERTLEEVGARQVILRNVLEAKFRLVGWEILNRVLQTPPSEKESAFQGFFTFTLFHEIAHSIGPHRIVKDGEKTTVNRCLRQHYSVLEEAKADILGACLALNIAGAFDVQTFLRTYVGGLLRSIRFGFGEAHGGSNTIQFNYLARAGAITADGASGKISINESGIMEALHKLVVTILDIQEQGDFDAAERLIASFRVIGPDLKDLIRRTEDLPIDIRIRFHSHPIHSAGQHRGFEYGDSQVEHEAELVER